MDTRVERGISGVSEMNLELVVLLGMLIWITVFAVLMRKQDSRYDLWFLDRGDALYPYVIDADFSRVKLVDLGDRRAWLGWVVPEEEEEDQRRERDRWI